MVKFIYVREEARVGSSGEFPEPAKVAVLSDAVTFSDLLEDFKAFALSLGFHPDTVNQAQMVEEEEEESEDSESKFMRELQEIDNG
jgi:hypothetical protein